MNHLKENLKKIIEEKYSKNYKSNIHDRDMRNNGLENSNTGLMKNCIFSMETSKHICKRQ